MWTVIKTQEDYEDWLEKCKFQYGEGSICETVPCSYFPNSVRMVSDEHGYYLPTFFDVQDAKALLDVEAEMKAPASEDEMMPAQPAETPVAFHVTVETMNELNGIRFSIGVANIDGSFDDAVSVVGAPNLCDRTDLLNNIQMALPDLDPKHTLDLATGLKNALDETGDFSVGQSFIVGRVTVGPEGILTAADGSLQVHSAEGLKLAS